MSFPVTDAPILIDVSGVGHTSRQSGSEVNPMGPFTNGTSQYVAFANTTDSSIRIFKSTDSGATWTLEDDAGSPDAGSIDPHSLNVFYDDSAKIIYVSYLITAVNRKVVAFDTNTDTYAAPIVWGFGTTIFFERTAVLIKQLSGPFRLFYSDNSSGNINYITLTGTTPSGPTLLVNLAGGKRDVDAGIQDASGAIHLSYGQDPGTRSYIRLDSSLTVTSGPTSFGNNDGFRADVLITSTNQLVFAWTDFSTILVEISASLTVPVFTKYTVATNSTGGDFSYASLAEDNSGNLLAFWAYVSSGDNIDEIESSTFDGVSTWSAPVLFYDEITNPPADSDAHQFIHTGQVKQLADDTWLYITAMETVSPTGCTGFALRIPGAIPPTTQTLTLLKVVQGGPASPSDFTLIATGGSPETTISGPGPQVGPDDVNAGVFELSEIAPGGAMWDAATSTWDGTAEWDGGGDYTPVWNCGAATMPTPTSVIVGSGGGSPVVAPTQVPTDPTFRSLLSGGRFEFASNGNVYQLGYTSNNKLGMYKRDETMAGASWTEMDAFGSPEQGDQSGYGKATQTGAIISVCYLRIGRTEAVICTFDTSTDTWGTPTAALVVESALTTFGFVQQSSGTYVLVGGGVNHFYVATNVGGSWNPILNLILNPTNVLDACVDSADAIHVLMISITPGTEYRRLDPTTYTPSSATGILNSTSLTLGGYPTISIWNGTNVVITGIDQGGAPAFKVQAFIGTPLAAPSFTTYVIATPSGETFSFPKLAQANDTTLHSFYVDDAGGGNITIKQSDFNGSTWSAPVTFYDAVAQPPNSGVPAIDQFFTALDPVELAPGSPIVPHWAIGAAMETLQPTEVSTAEVIESSSASSAVVCTVTNIFTGPPPGPPGPGQMNPVGCFELIRLDCTLVPARHLPTRGSVK